MPKDNQDIRVGAHLDVRSLTKRYAGRTVLDAVNLKIEPGEFVAVVGRSGCGKSTLLRAIAGLELPDAGQVRISGGGQKPEVRMMFQDARLLPWKTVLQNVALGLKDGEERARAALQSVGLPDRADDWPAALSGGQRQRVALARALVHEPQLLLLDEPLGALDALTRIEMQQLIESLWTARGFTAVLVTHDVQEAVVLADRILLIEQGRLALDLDVGLARPRARGSVEFGALEQKVLDRVLQTHQAS
ncbi:ATP-binding cassette domain-containing protein [Telluria mixta]|uniref:ATP-binding cassette domain-containing protein n=1 Tax=Telluria mixta TaxID=34071 RepID=A0ABT2BUV4_9BURK|nr:ATP-binding cassette domain-containing protein [Telluria mixta]MCS0628913.1 ATP-binding cassette domain-containing protein [Telluria mixta]WEM97364.1 ATP-binding cassette domain-containing protein [Telluria mixta]